MIIPHEELNEFNILLRLALAVMLGGIIGIERGVRNHPAGFRTYALVCVGACLAMLTNQFVHDNMFNSDPTRLGAQVITGVGFLGVGTILVTGQHRIKGLTTAAGLWASACIGLAVGIGFYFGAIAAALVIIVVLAVFPKLEYKVYSFSKNVTIYVELDSASRIKPLLAFIEKEGFTTFGVHYSAAASTGGAVGIHMTLRLKHGSRQTQAAKLIGTVEGVILVEEL